MKKKNIILRIPTIIYVLLSSFILRVFLSGFGTLELDFNTFIAWSNNLVEGGFKNFYNTWSDYLPGYLYILFVLNKINSLMPELSTLVYKLPAILSDLATGYLIYAIVKGGEKQNKKNIGKKALFYSLLYLFNPAIISNSTLWGQADSLTALFSLLGIYLFEKNIYLSALSLAVGTLIKPQAAFVLPAILYLVIKNKTSFYKVLQFAITGLVIFVLGFVPFNNNSSFIAFFIERLSLSSSQYPYGSVNAFSFWGLFGFWKSDQSTFLIGLTIALLSIFISSYLILKKRVENGQYLVAGLSFLFTFMFMTRMHERHLLPALAPILIYASTNVQILLSYFLLSLTYTMNMAYSFYWIKDGFKEIFNIATIRLFVTINLSSLVFILISIYKRMSKTITSNFALFFKSSHGDVTTFFNTKDISNKTAWILITLVFIFGLVSRVYKLNEPDIMYFDEIYHAFTARLVYQGDPKAWEWWNPHPEGYAYEWTHPPLSKIGMALGMSIFGDNSFGWRIVQAMLGSLVPLIIYAITTFIFKDKLTGVFAAFLFNLEGLPLVLSRMGMNDIYMLFFLLASIYAYLKDRNILSSVLFGFAFSSKWSAAYAAPVFLVMHFVFKKKIRVSYLAFVIIPPLIYLASYFFMFKTGHTFSQFIDMQKQMWWYHTNLDAEHPYTSPAWSWPLNLRPVYLYDGYTDDFGQVSRIYAFGNPLLLWIGLFSVLFSTIIARKERNRRLGFLVFSYLIFFLPWIASPRIMFFYHYLPSIPFLTIILAYLVRRFKFIRIVSLPLIAIAFLYFLPHWLGTRIPSWYDESFYWFSSWR